MVTVCKNSAYEATLKMGSFCSRFMTHEFKPVEFHATCCRDKILFPQQSFFAKTGMSHEEAVAATCPRNMSPSVSRPLHQNSNISSYNYVHVILGDPGAASRDDGIFVGQSEGGISNASGTRSVRVSAQGLSRSCCKLSPIPIKIPSSRLAAPGSPRMCSC